MAVLAANGVVGFGPQITKESVATIWYRHRATQVDLGVNDDIRQGDPEVGGSPVPTFPYKAGPVVAGGFTLQPRLEDTLGWLLYGMMGKVTSAETGIGSGIYDHVFEMATDTAFVPWMSTRKAVARRDGIVATDLGETYVDCKMVGGNLVLPNDSLINMRCDFLGRSFTLDHDPTLWTWENVMESWESVPIACATGGFIKFETEELPVVACQMSWQNRPLDLRAEKVYGDPFLEDITIVGRRLAIEMTVKWNNPDLYAKALTGAVNGTAWTSTPFTGALDVKSVSSVNIPGETEPYSLRVKADKIMLSPVGGIVLAAGGAVMLRFTGVALDSNGTYARFTLRNQATSYVWPVAS